MRLFVGNFPYETTERELTDLFADYRPSDLLICRDHGGFSKGFGFLVCEDSERAIADLNESKFNGRPLRVSIARDTSRDPRRKAAAAA